MKRPALEIQGFRTVLYKLNTLAANIYAQFSISDAYVDIVSYEDNLVKNAVELFDEEGKHVRFAS